MSSARKAITGWIGILLLLVPAAKATPGADFVLGGLTVAQQYAPSDARQVHGASPASRVAVHSRGILWARNGGSSR